MDDAKKRPFGEVVASAIEGFRTLARKQAELAKLEAKEAAAARAKGVGMFAGAGVLAVYATGFLAAAIAAALALVLPAWAACLIVALVLVAAAGVVASAGRRALRTAPTADRTRQTMKENARWAQTQIAR